jgi:large subunit ribosomal protein L20
MPRTSSSVAKRNRRKKILKAAKGYYGGKHRLYKTAKEQVEKSLQYAYRDRRQQKRNIRKLWIARINAAARMFDMNYSTLIGGMKRKNIDIDRKILADIAVKDINTFEKIVTMIKT